MESPYIVSAEAQNDLFEIWARIAEDSVILANRIDAEFYELFASIHDFPAKDMLGEILHPDLFVPASLLISGRVLTECHAGPNHGGSAR